MKTLISYLNRTNYLNLDLSELIYQLFLFFLAGVALFFIILIKSETATEFWKDPFIFLYTVFVTTFQLSRIVAAIFYKKSTEKIFEGSGRYGKYEPSVTFVIPCKNEEKTIAKTIEKCFEAVYPKEKIEVIVINDGSTDDTINVLRGLERKFEKLRVVDWKTNRGKRYGMAEGIRAAGGEIIIQLDSDSYIDPETFANIIKPFENDEIGAGCAHADPENADENFLTKMQAAYYFISFRVLKAAESTFMSVFCCSGCSSAYRKNVILPILDEWLNEKFLGLPVTWGDDRALTNRVLRMGYKTIYTAGAQAYTICPNNLKTFLKQQIRWKKGWFVNSLFASGFVLKKQPFVGFTYFFPLIVVTLATPFMATKALVYNPLFRGVSPFFYIAGIFLVAVIFVLYYRFVAKDNKYWPYVFAWSAINMIILSFILFYALATIQNRKWGTR